MASVLCASVLVEVCGPDAKAVKSHYAAFHTSRNGRTTLSCSGLALLPPANDGATTDTFHVLAPLSSIYPFLQQQHRLRLATVTQASLLPGASISLRLPTASGELRLVPAALAAVLPLPAAREAAEQLLQSTNGASPGSWRLGWLLAGQQPLEAATPGLLGHLAILTVDSSSPDTAAVATAAAAAHVGARQQCGRGCGSSGSDGGGCLRPGLGVAATGSPFGCLAPDQFQGAVVTGIVSNLLPVRPPGLGDPAAAGDAALFVVDARVLPGMEGGSISCRCCGRLLGLLGLPLTNNSSRVELMLGISANHVLAAAAAAAAANGEASADAVRAVTQLLQAVLTPAGCCGSSSGSGETSSCSSSLSLQPVLSVEPRQQLQPQQDDAPGACSCCRIDRSPCITTAAAAAGQAGVVMVRAGRSWGSGVLLTPSGIILTNAHLFGTPRSTGTSSSSSRDSSSSSPPSIRLSSPGGGSSGWLPAQLLHCFRSYLDLALLQVAPDALQQLPPSWHLLPLQLAGADAAPGDSVLVVGHGLFGPALGLSPLGLPAVTAGCAARVVELPAAASPSLQLQPPEKRQQFQQQQQQQQGRPSMVISTAAVHAGASGGALIGSADGRLVGLVTSNARHAGGSTLPHCNFSISAAELRPVWAWAQQQHQLWQQQQQQQSGQQHAGSGRRVTGVVSETALQQLRRLDSQQDSEAGRRLWALLPVTAGSRQQHGGGGGATSKL